MFMLTSCLLLNLISFHYLYFRYFISLGYFFLSAIHVFRYLYFLTSPHSWVFCIQCQIMIFSNVLTSMQKKDYHRDVKQKQTRFRLWTTMTKDFNGFPKVIHTNRKTVLLTNRGPLLILQLWKGEGSN